MSKIATGEANKKADALETTVDRFRYEEFLLSELAIDVIATMLGFNMKDAMAEEEKDNPDPERLKLLEEERAQLLGERQQIYRGNDDVKRICVDKYGPVIKARYETK